MKGKKKKTAKEIFSPVIKKFRRIHIQTHYEDECSSFDLIDRSSLSKYNKNYKFVFTVIDNHTKYAWAIPIKDKTGKSTTTAFKSLFGKAKRKPDELWSDRGKEVYNKTFLNFLKEQNIHIYSTHSDLKAVFVERFNRTLLDLIKEPMYIERKACWLIHLDTAMKKYNNRVHGTTKMTSFEISTNQKLKPNKKIIYYKHNTAKLASHTEGASRKQPKFQVGDYVRVPDKRNLYSIGFTPNWSRELFKIQKMNPTNPVTYG